MSGSRLLCIGLLLALCVCEAQGKELRRSMGFIRPWLMGGAYVAVADEATTLFYNPAGMGGIEENGLELINLQYNIDETVYRAFLVEEPLADRFTDLSPADLEDLVGTTLFASLSGYSPRLTFDKGSVIGLAVERIRFFEVLDVQPDPSLLLEFYDEALFFTGTTFAPTEHLHLGLTGKFIARRGLHRTFNHSDLFSGGTLNVRNHPSFQAAESGAFFTGLGVDLGFVYRFPGGQGWYPRLGASFLNIGGFGGKHLLKGIEFGLRPSPEEPPEAGEIYQLNNIGFALSPLKRGIRYTIAFDYVDFTHTVLSESSVLQHTRLGLEIAMGLRNDRLPLMSIFTGFNAGYWGGGLLVRIFIFEIGIGRYTVEMGDSSLKRPDHRYIAYFGILF